MIESLLIAAGIYLTLGAVRFLAGELTEREKEKQEQIEKLLGNTAFLPILILSVGLFGLFYNTDRTYDEGSKACSVWGFFDKYSFGIYLIHLIFLRTLIKVIDFNPFEYGIWMLPVIAVGVYICSLITMIIIKQIPGLKKLL